MRIVLIATAIIALAGPAPASAELRSGGAADPVGDSAGAPSQDLIDVSGRYDTNGQIIVTARVNGDIASGPPSFLMFKIASYSAPSSCTGVNASLYGFTDSEFNYSTITGYPGSGSQPVVVIGDGISFGASGNGYANKDWSCMTVVITPKDNGGQTLDELSAPIYFDGYGPDSDGDGVKDNADQCPAGAGPAPTGCPAPVAPPPPPAAGPSTAPAGSTPLAPAPAGSVTPRCRRPNVKGKTLKAAKALIKKRNCKLGTVRRPKRVPRGATLVVKKQSGSTRISLGLGVRTPRR